MLEVFFAEAEGKLEEKVLAFLEEAGSELESAIARGTPVDNGQLKNSWGHVVDKSEKSVTIGSNLENAIWNEFGTGTHADDGKGRKDAWYVSAENYTGRKRPTYKGKVVIAYGKNGRKFYKTDGKPANHTMQHAYDQTAPKIKKRLKYIMGDMS